MLTTFSSPKLLIVIIVNIILTLTIIQGLPKKNPAHLLWLKPSNTHQLVKPSIPDNGGHNHFLHHRRRTTTVTVGSVSTVSTATTTVTQICAKLVNVTGPCRLKRGFWEEEPIILTFSDIDLDPYLQILSTPVISIDPTFLPERIPVPNVPPDYGHGLFRSGQELSSSIMNYRHFFPYRPGPIIQLASALVNSIVTSGLSPKTTTITTLEKVTATETVTSVNTFFIQLCTPSPFPFTQCNQINNIIRSNGIS